MLKPIVLRLSPMEADYLLELLQSVPPKDELAPPRFFRTCHNLAKRLKHTLLQRHSFRRRR
jgi:hypothetical protein